MNKIFILIILATILSCQKQEKIPLAQHVILIGLDGMGAQGLEMANTPYIDELAKNGAITLIARAEMPTISGSNWTSMLTGTAPIHHGVITNNWSTESYAFPPSLKNNIGAFPSIFDHIRQQRPDIESYMFYEWKSLDRPIDLEMPHLVVHNNSADTLFQLATEAFLREKPGFSFIAIDETDGYGHRHGWNTTEFLEGIEKWDARIGDFVNQLKDAGLLENTIIIITGDHGGINKGHGGNTPDEILIPIVLWGKGIAPGTRMSETHLIADIPATIAGLLNIKLPGECTGRFIHQAFEKQ